MGANTTIKVGQRDKCPPVAFLLMREWLKSFAYRVHQDASGLAIVASITFVLIVISAGYAAVKAGAMNPIKVIKED